MNLKIERWLSEQKWSSKVMILFDESIKSYKASAYKASLLFSYLAFMTILKERIVKSQVPSGIPPALWIRIIKEVQNRESWDKSVLDSTQRQKPAVIFPISETIRREVVYWKDRRNDCAHFKHENINYHHVESFWSFLETNLGKFVVNGSKDALLLKLLNHFDIAITPPDQDLTPLISEIESAIETDDLYDFFGNIESDLGLIWEEKHFIVFNAILSYYDNNIAAELIAFLKADEFRLLGFIRFFPEKVQYLNLSNEIIRELWYSKLFRDSRDDYKVYSSLLRNNLIRSQDIDEANQRIKMAIIITLKTRYFRKVG